MTLPLVRTGLFVAVLLLAIPGAQAQNVHFETVTVSMEPTRFDAELVGQIIEGANSRTLRNYIDTEHGNGDGSVSADEVAAYRTAEMDEFNGALSSPLARTLTANIKVNDRAPLQQVVTDVHLSTAVLGPVDSEAAVVRNINASITFPSTERERVNVTFKQNFAQAFITTTGRMEWETATFLGREPWAIDGETVTPGGTDNPYWTGEGFTVAYAEMANFSGWNNPLGFNLVDTRAEERSEGKGSPAPALPFALAALGLLVWVRRRVA